MRFYFCTFDDEKLEEDVALELDLYNLALDILKGRIFLSGNKAMEILVQIVWRSGGLVRDGRGW